MKQTLSNQIELILNEQERLLKEIPEMDEREAFKIAVNNLMVKKKIQNLVL